MNLKFNEPINYQQVPFKKGIITCPACNKRHRWHCSITDDEGLCLCKYNSESDRTAKDGRYIHLLKESTLEQNKEFIALAQEKSESPVADAELLNEVYTYLLMRLGLNESHKNQLIDRGLSEDFINENQYASVPDFSQRIEIAEELAKCFDLTKIPGFYLKDEKWNLHLTYSGIYIPYRDELGRITGLQIRRDDTSQGKYLTLSSSSKGGTKPNSLLHFVYPEKVRKRKSVIITEGALKADVGAFLDNDYGFVAMAGLTAKDLIRRLNEAFPDLETVYLAFDMDWETNEDVKGKLYRLIGDLQEASLKTRVLTWDRNFGKGIDDFILQNKNSSSEEKGVIKGIEGTKFQKLLDETPVIESENISDENMGLKAEVNGQVDTFGICWKEFQNLNIPEPEKVIFGLNRGNVGLLNATTNIGKTTLILNLAISAASNREFYPFLNSGTIGKRILYIDGEATKSELQKDIKTMIQSLSEPERKLLEERLCFICDEELNDEPLDLVNSEHLKVITETALSFKPDLIVVDTLSALTIMEDENDNAIVKKEVIQPLKKLAKTTNAGVLILHHTGKFNEGSAKSVELAFRGRGASALGALARVVFNLDWVNNKKHVKLSCSKAKTQRFEDVSLKLDVDSRWFQVVEKSAKTSESEGTNNYQKVIKFVRESGQEVKRKIIVSHLAGQMSRNKVDFYLSQALGNKDLIKGKKYGTYTIPLKINWTKK